MKNLRLVIFLSAFALVSLSSCTSYEEDQEVFDQISEFEQLEGSIELETSSGSNSGQDPR